MKQHYLLNGSIILIMWLFLTFSFTARATHIVGGELELQYQGNTSGYSHRINLNLYFDDVNGSPDAKDQTVNVFVFRKRDNGVIGSILLDLVSDTYVRYTQPACAIGSLRTRLIRYSTEVTLEQEDFSDAGGYYMVWERCCRNSTITNIVRPGEAGSAFYLEFPAVWSSGTLVKNSSPVFGTAKGDYVCLQRPFTFDFSAKDPDGDSLVYALVTPYNGFSDTRFPNPGNPDPRSGQVPTYDAGPYPDVSWGSGFSASNSIPGPQPLRVDAQTGQLSVTADQIGLFVFSVQVDEYRQGVRIGRVRRDFQLKVIDCLVNNPPQVMLMTPAGLYQAGTVLTLSEKQSNCLNLLLTDPNPNQTVQLTVLTGLLTSPTLAPGLLTTRTEHDTLQTQLCFGRCSGSATGQPIRVQLLATDNGCPQPLRDTLTILLTIVPDSNHPPAVTTTLPQPQVVDLVVPLADSAGVQFDVLGNDADLDTLRLYAQGQGFDYAKLNMKFSAKTGPPTLTSTFQWAPTCALLNGKTEATFQVSFVADDHRCPPTNTDTTTVTLHVHDLTPDYEISVPNVFTPNHDGFNDYFTVPDLPANTCTEQFRSVTIVNRWGRLVFTSQDRNFRWYGDDYPGGEYFYHINYSRHTYKGPLTLLR